MQNWANITPVEVVAVGSAMLVLCVAPTVLAWSDTRRRRKALAQAAALEAAARAALIPPPVEPPPVAAAVAPSLMDLQVTWDEPTATVNTDLLDAPVAAAVAAAALEAPVPAPVEPPASLAEAPAVEAAAEPPQPIEPAIESPTPAEPMDEPAAVGAPFAFCLQDLRRVRLPNWPPPEVNDDPVRSAVWRDAERLAAQHAQAIGAAALTSPQPVQSSCLGAAEADGTCTRLRFFLFEVLWPSTAEQAIAEAVFEIEADGATIRSSVRRLRRSHR